MGITGRLSGATQDRPTAASAIAAGGAQNRLYRGCILSIIRHHDDDIPRRNVGSASSIASSLSCRTSTSRRTVADVNAQRLRSSSVSEGRLSRTVGECLFALPGHRRAACSRISDCRLRNRLFGRYDKSASTPE